MTVVPSAQPVGHHDDALSESSNTNALQGGTNSRAFATCDSGEIELSSPASADDGFLLAATHSTGEINYDDHATPAIPHAPPPRPSSPPDPNHITILYTSQTPPIISPAVAIMRCRKPPTRSAGYCTSPRVNRISETLLVKRAGIRSGMENEARTMLFVREKTSIPIPKVHLVFNYLDLTYIVMDYIEGADLQHLWHTFQETERQSVLSQVDRYLRELRSIGPSSHVPGPLGGGFCDGPWFSYEGSGPFVSHKHLAKWFNSFIESPHRLPLSDQRFTADAPLVFTHRDFLPRNLILSRGTVWVVDWALSGWYPPYMEYCSIAADIGHPDCRTPSSWREVVLPMLGDYQQQYILLRKVQGEIAFSNRRNTISPPPEDEEASS